MHSPRLPPLFARAPERRLESSSSNCARSRSPRTSKPPVRLRERSWTLTAGDALATRERADRSSRSAAGCCHTQSSANPAQTNERPRSVLPLRQSPRATRSLQSRLATRGCPKSPRPEIGRRRLKPRHPGPQPYFVLLATMPPMDRLEIAKGVEATRDFALLLRDERALVISDLHLGFEGALAEQGVSIPRFQRRVILERLGQMFDRTKAEQVIIAGDFKHEFSKNLVDEWVEVKQVLRFIRDRAKPVLVRGNHDNYLATILGDLNLPLNARADVGGYTIVHGHEEVSTLHPIVMGHEHPAVKLKDELGATVSVPAFLVTERLSDLARTTSSSRVTPSRRSGSPPWSGPGRPARGSSSSSPARPRPDMERARPSPRLDSGRP